MNADEREFLSRAHAAIFGSRKPAKELSMIERVERALVIIAYAIELDGDVYVPTYQRFEAELIDLRRKADVRKRARKHLEAFVRQAGGST